jgi:hypothetical protein
MATANQMASRLDPNEPVPCLNDVPDLAQEKDDQVQGDYFSFSGQRRYLDPSKGLNGGA